MSKIKKILNSSQILNSRKYAANTFNSIAFSWMKKALNNSDWLHQYMNILIYQSIPNSAMTKQSLLATSNPIGIDYSLIALRDKRTEGISSFDVPWLCVSCPTSTPAPVHLHSTSSHVTSTSNCFTLSALLSETDWENLLYFPAAFRRIFVLVTFIFTQVPTTCLEVLLLHYTCNLLSFRLVLVTWSQNHLVNITFA